MKRRINILMKTVGLIGLVLSLLLFAQGKPLHAAEPIKIGVILSITGRGGFLGTPEKEAITVVVEDVNRQGGLFGRQIELYFEDDQSNPTNSAIAATKLIRDKKVSCLIGSSLVVGCMAILPICEQEEVPQIAPAPITIPLKKWIFCVPVTDYRLGQRMLKFAVDTFGAKKIALLHSTDTYGMNGAQGIVENVDKHGASIVITEKFEPADTSMIPQLTKVKAARPDLIMLYANANPAAVIAKNLQQLGMETPLVASAGIPTPDFLKLVGKIVEGGRWIIFGLKDLYADQLPPDDLYRKNLFDPLRKAIQEKYGKTEWNGFYRNGYDPIRIAIEGLKIAGTDDRAALRDALEKVRYSGFLGDFKYSPTDHEGTLGEAFVPVIIKDGKYIAYEKK
jgi:branched-chain amino acid transport system substrate-binding protein